MGKIKSVVRYLIWRLILKNPALRLRLQNLLIRDKTEIRDVLGVPLAINSRSEIGYWRASVLQNKAILLRDEIPQILSVIACLEPGMVFVDAGANVGFWTMQVGKLSHILPGLTVQGFEPNPETFEKLKATVDGLPQIKVFNLALSDSPREIEMVSGATSGVFGVPSSDFQIKDKVTVVKADTLDSLMGDHKRIFIKIDVEGHEFEVLKGATELMSRGAVAGIYIDSFDSSASGDISRLLGDFGFALFDGRFGVPATATSHSVIALPQKGR